jgi:hypothetical protein
MQFEPLLHYFLSSSFHAQPRGQVLNRDCVPYCYVMNGICHAVGTLSYPRCQYSIKENSITAWLIYAMAKYHAVFIGLHCEMFPNSLV